MSQDVGPLYAPDAAQQDIALGVTMTVTQADLPYLRAVGSLGEYAVVYRVWREQAGGGFGDQSKNPQTWGVLVYVNGQLARIYSARGAGREWSNLDRLEKWLRSQGFWYWWTRNDLEPLGEEDDTPAEAAAVDGGDEDGEDADRAPAAATPPAMFPSTPPEPQGSGT
ncbi:hypothetical protein L2D14_13385 [Thalassospiraceae bacterium LMO-JJ14]|nr:hypothetical protein L2D14_13385 [Thalassospiraceae bacterium LMO-JJ14]